METVFFLAWVTRLCDRILRFGFGLGFESGLEVGVSVRVGSGLDVSTLVGSLRIDAQHPLALMHPCLACS